MDPIELATQYCLEGKPRQYACMKCGTLSMQSTNHTGPTWSLGRYNTCPNCPPYAKYPEYGGRTDWVCVETMSEADKDKLWGIGRNK